MSWAVVPSRYVGGDVALVGRGADAGRLCVGDRDRGWVVPKNPQHCWGPGISVDGSNLARDPDSDADGNPTFGNCAAWYCSDDREWVYAPSLPPGCRPVEIHVEESYDEYGEVDVPEHYEGDAYYTFASLPAPGGRVELEPRGSLRPAPGDEDGDGEPKYVEWWWPRYEHAGGGSGFCGDYADMPDDGSTPSGGAVAAFSIGCCRVSAGWRSWVRSAVKDGSGHWTYAKFDEGDNTPPLAYDASAGKYVIGERGSAGGWWEAASAPGRGGDVTFEGRMPDDSEDDPPADLVVSFASLVPGMSLVPDAYLAEVPRWL